MNLINILQLLYIPTTYWNESLSGFQIVSKGKLPPKNSDFFIAWITTDSSEEELNKQLKFIFPGIPVDRLLTCRINLAVPLKRLSKDKEKKKNSNFIDVSSFLVKVMPVAPTIKILYEQNLSDFSEENGVKSGSSIKTWTYLTKLLFEILNKGQFIPSLDPLSEKSFVGRWKILLKSSNDKEQFSTIINSSLWPSFCLPVDFIKINGKIKTSGLWHPSYLFSTFLNETADSFIRSVLNKGEFTAFKDFYSKEIKKESDINFKSSWDYRFLKSLINFNQNFKVEGFHETILPSIIENWTHSVQTVLSEVNFSFNIEVKYPKELDDQWILSFYFSSSSFDEKIPLSKVWNGESRLIEKLAHYFESKGQFLEVILRSLGIARKIFPPIEKGLEESIKDEIFLSSKEILHLLSYPKDILIQNGFNLILPEVFRRGGKQRLSTRILIRLKDRKKKIGSTYSILPSLFDIKSMLESTWDVKIGDKQLSENELKSIIATNEPLLKIDDNWVLIEQQDLEELKSIKNPKIDSYMEALKLGLTEKIQLEAEGYEYDVILEGDLYDIIQNLKSIEKIEEISPPSSFNGVLRPYQEDGLTWMANLARYNFGLCLADDMGLGKTIQVIAFLCHLKESFPNNPGSYLVICPTSILFNWNREIKKFASNLDVYFHHGATRIRDVKQINEFNKSHRVILTSYGTIRNDIDLLKTVEFSGIIVDESQNMKNYTSKQTQAIYNLKSLFRICLSGTPIENRLLELWSLFNFLNPGLLGTRAQFQREFILPIERFKDQKAIDKLKSIISPFILRRLKSDKSIIKELPEKNEIKILIELSEDQSKLYKDLVETTLLQIESLSYGENQSAIVLSLLVKLKQICNHPYQYLKKDISSIEGEQKLKEIISKSKKLKRLIQMTDEVITNNEKILIFTQFTQMGEILEKVLFQKFRSKVLYFHGGVPEKKRRDIVDQFQSKNLGSPKILIVSLKAGGTGLNLTQGNTVVHFDRWWNPAVEDQATDRAYRIGQKSVVNVYKFISKGTIEEKIDLLLEEKRELAEQIITTSGESWISELDGKKLREILLLTE